MKTRGELLAERIAEGHRTLTAFATALSEEEWRADCPTEGRPVGVLIHHVASVLPVELDVIRMLASAQPVTATAAMIDDMNAQHALEHAECDKQETLDLLRHNSAEIVAAIREMTDAELDNAATVTFHWGAPLTAQYFIEEHPLSHAYRHLASIRETLGADAGE